MRAKLSAWSRFVVSGAVRGAAILSGGVLGAIIAGTVVAAAVLGITVLVTAPPSPAQSAPDASAAATQPGYSQIYCSGFVKDTKVPDDMRLVSGEEAYYKIVFSRGDYVYLNRGAEKGVQVGDRFMVVRSVEDPAKSEWFKGQQRIMSAMGTLYRDLGQLRVVNVQPKVSIAEVSFSCEYMQRGDLVRPYEERPVPPYKEAAPFDPFAPVSGKPVGMLVSSIDFAQAMGQYKIAYVNLGAAQGVKIGDYVRIFRHEGKVEDNLPVTKGYYYEVYGFGSVPQRYDWHDLPREVLGEALVLNASRNSATVLITYLRQQVFTGDEIELE